MRRLTLAAVAILTTYLSGCDFPAGPKLAITSEPVTQAGTVSPPARPPEGKRPGATRYQGKTADEWYHMLDDADPATMREACRVLHVLGRAGRAHLLQGLEHSNPEVRRLCLESVSISDFRAHGEHGRQLLVKLSGDTQDMRIRQRAAEYLQRWNQGVIPSPS